MSSHPHLAEARRLLNMLGIPRVYFVALGEGIRQLTAAEVRYGFGRSTEDVIAFTSPVNDLMFSNSLIYEWQGRGCCIVFRRHPGTFSQGQVLGIAIHEAAHWLADCDQPCRDDTNAERAVLAHWKSMKRAAEYHSERWLRALVHAWWRANAAGWSIPLSQTINLEQYGFQQNHLAPLLTEARLREREPIEAILRSGDVAQQRLQQVRSTKRAAPAAQARRRAKYPRVESVGGYIFKRYIDGSIETLPDLHGRGGGKRFTSVIEVLGGSRRARA